MRWSTVTTRRSRSNKFGSVSRRAATLKKVLEKSTVFVFVAAKSEMALVERLVDRKTEIVESLLVRIGTARKEMKHVKNFDYVVVNAKGKLDNAVKLMESIIDAEKARVSQRTPLL